jgi:hypothetical protein
VRQLFFIVAFWIVVVVAMRLAVSFPKSLLARVFFTPFGPEPLRGEPRSSYFLRCARFGASWFAQSLALFAIGWLALEWNASLANSLFFLVLWAVVIPALGGCALVVSLCALGRCIWIRSFGRTLTRIQG